MPKKPQTRGLGFLFLLMWLQTIYPDIPLTNALYPAHFSYTFDWSCWGKTSRKKKLFTHSKVFSTINYSVVSNGFLGHQHSRECQGENNKLLSQGLDCIKSCTRSTWALGLSLTLSLLFLSLSPLSALSSLSFQQQNEQRQQIPGGQRGIHLWQDSPSVILSPRKWEEEAVQGELKPVISMSERLFQG